MCTARWPGQLRNAIQRLICCMIVVHFQVKCSSQYYINNLCSFLGRWQLLLSELAMHLKSRADCGHCQLKSGQPTLALSSLIYPPATDKWHQWRGEKSRLLQWCITWRYVRKSFISWCYQQIQTDAWSAWTYHHFQETAIKSNPEEVLFFPLFLTFEIQTRSQAGCGK